MMHVRAWLPDGVTPPAALQRSLAECVDGWARRWFAVRPPVLQPLSRHPAVATTWRELDGIMLGCTASGMAELGAHILDVAPTDRTDADRALLEELAEPCLADLRAVLATMGGQAGKQDWRPAVAGPCWMAWVGEGRAPIAVGWSTDRFATLVRRSMPPAVSPPLGSPAAALSRLAVSVGGAAGRISLTVADLAALDIGDIVLLDGKVSASMPIAVDGRALSRGRVAVVAATPAPFLKIIDPLQ